ncbi:hypothetical protein BH23PLA1_BH23PLA1_18020 [soil metagenome]
MTRFESLYRISLYLLLFLSTLILNMDSDAALLLEGGGEFRYAGFFPVAMALACILAFWTVDRDPKLGLSVGWANLLGLGSIVLVVLEYSNDPNQLVLAVGHWLFYLCLVKMFRPKSAGDDWYLILLGLVQVVVGCFLSQSDRVGLALLTWSLLALWVLGLFFLYREADRAGRQPRPEDREPYPNLFTIPFFFSALRAALTTLLLGGLIFLAMPRRAQMTQPQSDLSGGRHLTGFSDQVQLGQLGEILENDTVVMSIELFDDQGRRVDPEVELLWRGVVLTRYDSKGRQWSRERENIQIDTLPDDSKAHTMSGRRIRQNIRLEDVTGTTTAFALRPILGANVKPEGILVFNSLDGTLIRDLSERLPTMSRGNRVYRRGGSLSYSVVSLLTQDTHIQPDESRLSLDNNDYRLRALLRLPENLREPLEKIAAPLVEGLEVQDRVGRARALEAFLRDSNQFHYSLQMRRVDPQIDPNLDFLLHRREGHCEYFASALTVLLRSQGIPSRMVNGFKGGDWNGLSLTVRQRHAHSWVEALVRLEKNGTPVWLTLDPTPPSERDEIVARVSRLPVSIRQVSDLIRYLWVFYIAGFNAERQEQMLYQPIRELWAAAQMGFLVMGEKLRSAFGWLIDFPSPAAFFSIKGFFVSFFVMLLSVAAVLMAQRAWGLFGRRQGGSTSFDADSAGMMSLYARLSRVLVEYGLERPPAETPREFAHRAADRLRHRDTDGPGLAEIPPTVVDAFYHARFGNLPLAQQDLEHLERQLDTLEFSLQPEPAS